VDNSIVVRVATSADVHYAELITNEMAESAKARGTGIARRSPDYVAQKMREGKAVIAHTADGTWVGFCYIEAWEHDKYVANSGLIVSPPFRKSGVARAIKRRIFELSRQRYPEAKIFGLTTGLAVMKINSELGYEPVTYSELTSDDEFWRGCQSCVNYEILMAKQRKNCLCTAMLYDPATAKVPAPVVQTVVTPQGKIKRKRRRFFKGNFKLFERWVRFKQFVLLRNRKNGNGNSAASVTKNILTYFIFW
jgi:GNAT superfamily N-acetyltransferase